MTEVPDEVRALAAERDERRRAKDFAAADSLRDRIAQLGFAVIDGPDGPSFEPLAAAEPRRIAPHDVESVLDEPPTGGRERALGGRGMARGRGASARRLPRERGRPRRPVRRRRRHRDGPGGLRRGRRGPRLEPGTGWGAARNAGLKRSRGRIVLAMDGSVEPTGDVFGPLEAALGDPSVGCRRSVRHLDRRPARVPRQRRAGGRRDRGLPDGVPPGRDPRRRAVRREVPLVPDGRHRVLVPDQGRRHAGAPGRRAGHASTSTGCTTRPRPPSATGCPNATTTGSWNGSETGSTCSWSPRSRGPRRGRAG